MNVTQELIAKKLGLARITVNKILNKEPGYKAAKETKEKVFKLAKELGYSFSNLLKRYRRRHQRIPIKADVHINIFTGRKRKPYDKGKGKIENISEGGALLTDVRLSKKLLPLKPIRLRLRIKGVDLYGELMWVRTDKEVKIGVKYKKIGREDLIKILKLQ